MGVKIDGNLTWQHHVNDLSIKLNRANALLFKMRQYVSLKVLRPIYFAIFDSYLSYCCLFWAQNFSTIDQHNYQTSSSTQGNLMKLFYKANRYGKYSITISAVESWNKIQKQLKNMLLKACVCYFFSNFYFSPN